MVFMTLVMILTAALILLILMNNSMHVTFVTGDYKTEHKFRLQKASAQVTHSQPKASTFLISETISPVLLAPVATSGNNVYLVWSSNKSGNYEIMFRASSDHGQTFGNKLNLSNSTSESQNVEVQSSGDRVFVTWWERNSTSNEPVLRISNDKGQTFGPIFKLSSNGIINNR